MSGGSGPFAFFFIILLISLPVPADPSLLYSFFFASHSTLLFLWNTLKKGKFFLVPKQNKEPLLTAHERYSMLMVEMLSMLKVNKFHTLLQRTSEVQVTLTPS